MSFYSGISSSGSLQNIFSGSPSQVGRLDSFASPRNIGDYYGVKMQALFVAPQTGTYFFYAVSDDDSIVYLSTNDQESGKIQIIHIPSPITTFSFVGYVSY